jgi:hypothetical protein
MLQLIREISMKEVPAEVYDNLVRRLDNSKEDFVKIYESKLVCS